jgi:hypothetical protein
MGIVILALVSLIITLPLFLSNGLFVSHDILFHYIWSEQFYNAFIEGVLYPRWVDTPYGYGSATFIFYAPLSFYVISVINILIKSQILSMNLAIYLSFFLSGLSMYFFIRELQGERAGVVSGVLYELLPYHILNLYIRGVIPELFAYIWFPLILLFIQKIFINRRSSMLFMSLSYAGLIMTHLVSSFMFSFVMVGYGLYLFLVERKKGMSEMLCAMALGIGLSSLYLMPVVFEKGLIHIEFIKIFNYKDYFLFLFKNLMDNKFYPILHEIVIIEAAFLIFSFLQIKRKVIYSKNAFFVLLLFVSLFLTTPLSLFIWKYMPGFTNLQFPWRWLIFSGLSVSIIAGDLAGNFKGEVQKAVSIILFPLLIMSFFIMSQISFFKSKDIDYFRAHSGLFSPVEYRPVWLKDYRKMLPAVEKVQIIKGNGSVDILDWKSNQRLLLVNGETPLDMRFSTFYFPGWEAKIDGKRCGIMIDKDSGSIVIEVPEGRHKIELNFRGTPVRYYGKVTSLISLVLLFLVYLYEKQKFSKKQDH